MSRDETRDFKCNSRIYKYIKSNSRICPILHGYQASNNFYMRICNMNHQLECRTERGLRLLEPQRVSENGPPWTCVSPRENLVSPCKRSKSEILLQHIGEAVVERSKVAVVVEHRPPQHALRRRRHKARHRVVPDGRVLRLALSVHLRSGASASGQQAISSGPLLPRSRRLLTKTEGLRA